MTSGSIRVREVSIFLNGGHKTFFVNEGHKMHGGKVEWIKIDFTNKTIAIQFKIDKDNIGYRLFYSGLPFSAKI